MTSFKKQAEQYVSAIMQRLEQETAISGFCLDQELFIVPTGDTLEWQMFVLTNSGKTYIDESISDQQLIWLVNYACDSMYNTDCEPEDVNLDALACKLAHLAA